MPWQRVRCFECGTVYGKEWVRNFYHTFGNLEYCPRCGCDYLLGFKDSSSNITIR